MKQTTAVRDYGDGLLPPNWTRDASSEGIAFMHRDRGIVVEAVKSAEAVGMGPGPLRPDCPTRWTLVCRRTGRETETRRTIDRAATDEEAVATLYDWMERINDAIHDAGDAQVDLVALGDRLDPQVTDHPREEATW